MKLIPDNLTASIRGLQQRPDVAKVLLAMEYLNPLPKCHLANPKHVLILDTETSGLNAEESHLIEIAGVLVPFDIETGDIFAPTLEFCELQDLPDGEVLPPLITKVTGITSEDIKGKSIDQAAVIRAFEQADLVVSHNATFDRPFIEKGCEFLGQLLHKPWACTLADINWKELIDTPSASLAVIANYSPVQPFFYSAHRALTDCHALTHALFQVNNAFNTPILKELYDSANNNVVEIYAVSAPYEAKNLLSAQGFKWNDGTKHPNIKAWSKIIDKTSAQGQEDISMLHEKVFGSRPAKLAAKIKTKGNRFSRLTAIEQSDRLVSFNLAALHQECLANPATQPMSADENTKTEQTAQNKFKF